MAVVAGNVVNPARLPARLDNAMVRRIAIISVIAVLALGIGTWRIGSFDAMWLTPDQQGRWAYEQLEFSQATDLFADPAWKGLAAYRSGRYIEAAASFGRLPSAVGFFNRGNAFLKGREYHKAISAYEQAVTEDPDWPEAQENLALSRYILVYLENTRDATDTGDESELGADEFKFDNTKERGVMITITNESTIELESADKWMRMVDTQTRDFLRSRFSLEASKQASQ